MIWLLLIIILLLVIFAPTLPFTAGVFYLVTKKLWRGVFTACGLLLVLLAALKGLPKEPILATGQIIIGITVILIALFYRRPKSSTL